ncbi:MAG: hypothetical protein NC388_10730 [Clostridium sp.]|nr:hypothetical protein [Clostridium sp.]
MRDDIIDLMTASLPESCNEQLLSDYAENKNFHKSEKYKSTTEKILTLSKDTTLQAQITAIFHEPLKKFANAKIRKPKPIAAQACSESYLNAFASFWSRYEYSSLLEGIIEREIHNAAAGATVRVSYNTKQAGSSAYAYGVMEREARKRLDNMKEYCQENAPIFWRNQFLERGITEEDLQAVTPPLSAESLESIKQLNQYMAKHQKDNKQALLKSFGAWHTKWYNDPNEDHSVLTQTLPAPTKPTEKFWYKRNVITLYREGWLGTSLNLKELEENIQAIYLQSLNTTNTVEVATMTDEEKQTEAEKMKNEYKEERLEEYITAAVLPLIEKQATEEELHSLIIWLKKENVLRYANIADKLQNTDLTTSLIKRLEKQLIKILEGERAKAIKPMPCDSSYLAVFNRMISQKKEEEIKSLLEQVMKDPQIQMIVRMLPNGQYRMDKALKYMQNNAKNIMLNTCIERGLTEEELMMLSDPAMECYGRISETMKQVDRNALQRNVIQDFAQWYKTYHTPSVLDQPEKYQSLVVMLLNSNRERTLTLFNNLRSTYEDLALERLNKSTNPQVKRLSASARQQRAKAQVERYFNDQLTTDLATVYTPYLKENLNGNKLSRYLSSYRAQAVQVATQHESMATNDSTISRLVESAYEQYAKGKTVPNPQLTDCSDKYKKLFDCYYPISQEENIKQMVQTMSSLMGILNSAEGMANTLSEEDRKEIELAKQALENGNKYLEKNWYTLLRNSFVNHVTEQDMETLIEFSEKPLTRQVN